ncbi:DUF3892 domain-containing protein [Oceanirhabdus seepicola]|uniref:DUF3892 domain-containing protein n=1 Tax=Oceanirhabdus seepicola TaxID=2828781 RepID=A0A9J6P4G4_9CLOT|nr:DUF3892 domain-containing protein [Oceanirhabdus seepicola]MCM1991467.1 DUF3892 domain-containing protein [Oceanirhabdus seepicola]
MKIVKVRKNQDGDITNIMTNTGEVLTATQAVAATRAGQLDSTVVKKNRHGVDVISSTPRTSPDQILDNLPNF